MRIKELSKEVKKPEQRGLSGFGDLVSLAKDVSQLFGGEMSLREGNKSVIRAKYIENCNGIIENVRLIFSDGKNVFQFKYDAEEISENGSKLKYENLFKSENEKGTVAEYHESWDDSVNRGLVTSPTPNMKLVNREKDKLIKNFSMGAKIIIEEKKHKFPMEFPVNEVITNLNLNIRKNTTKFLF